MPTSSDVRSAWSTAVWQSASVQAITPNVFLHDISIESDLDASRLLHETVVNFFVCRVQRQVEPLLAGNTRYTYEVQVEYYLQQTDAAASTYNALVDRLELVDDLVLSALGVGWGGTVDYYQGGRPLPVSSVEIDERACWKGGYVYTAFKTT